MVRMPAGTNLFLCFKSSILSLGPTQLPNRSAMWGAFLGGKVTEAWGRPNLHLVPKLRMGFNITPFPPYAFMACTVTKVPFVFIIRRHCLLAGHVINHADKFASLWKRQFSLSLLTKLSPPFVEHEVYNAASNYIYCTRLKAKCWPQDEEPANPAALYRNRTPAACRYVSHCYTSGFSELHILTFTALASYRIGH